MTSSKIIADLKDMLRAFQGKGWSARSAMRAVINHGRPVKARSVAPDELGRDLV
jgi:hypothetical protein